MDGYPDLVRRLAARHQMANHTYDHPFMADLTPAEMRQELALAESTITSVAGRNPSPFWRPPYGNYDDTVLAVAGEMGYRYTIYWSIDTQDWAGPSSQVIRQRLVNSAFPGGIALMHGSPLATPEGTRLAVGDLRARGYQFVTVSEILGIDRDLRDFGGDRYVVQPGDDLEWVAGCHNLTGARLAAYNELAERLGAEVTWDGARVHVVKGTTELIITPGDRVALVNGAPADMGTAALMENDRVLVPVRFLAERLGAAVGWDGETWRVTIDQ